MGSNTDARRYEQKSIRQAQNYSIFGNRSLGYRLIKNKKQWELEVTHRQDDKKDRKKIPIPRDEVEDQILALKSSHLPAFPISPDVCDGEYVELTVFGEPSEIKMSSWTIGAEDVEKFANWLREIGDS